MLHDKASGPGRIGHASKMPWKHAAPEGPVDRRLNASSLRLQAPPPALLYSHVAGQTQAAAKPYLEAEPHGRRNNHHR